MCSTVAERLLQALKIRDGEASKVLLMALYLFSAVSCFVMGRIAATSLLLKVLDKGDLAYMYITVAVVVLAPAYIYARLADRYRRDRVIQGTLVCLVVPLAASWFLVHYASGIAVYIFLYNFVEVLGAFLMIQFWTFASDIFSSREAKRLFPVVGGGGVIGGITAGIFAGRISKAFGTESNLIVMVGLLLLCFYVVTTLGHRERSRLNEHRADRKRSGGNKKFALRAELGDVFKSKHLKIIAGMTVATFISVPIIDYQFKAFGSAWFTVNGVYQTDNFSAFQGHFYTVTGIIGAITQFGFASRILERFGVVTALMVLPSVLMLGAGGMLAVSIMGLPMLFQLGVLSKGAEASFRYSIYDATLQVLYTPVPGQVRARAKTVIDGILKPLATGTGGLTITLVVEGLGMAPDKLSYAVGVLIAAWIALILAIRREYVAQLLATLRRRRLDFTDASLSISDEATVQILKNALNSDDSGEVRNAVQLAARVVGHDLTDDLADLLQHPRADIRTSVLDILAEKGSMRHTQVVQRCFDDDAEEVQAAAIRAFCAIVGEPALRVVQSQLHRPAPAVRAATVASLIRHGGLEGILVSAEHLKAMQSSDDDDLRLAAAHVFREIGVKNFYQPVLQLMRDANPKVQAAAVAAAGAMKSPELIPSLIYKLARRETARTASHALSEYGPEVAPTLGKVLGHEPEDVAIRRQIPRILERIGTRRCLQLLLDALEVNDRDTRREVARSAARLRDRLDVEVDELRIRRLIDQELNEYFQMLAALDDLSEVAGARGPDLLRDALEERLLKTLDRVFRLLGIVYPLKHIDLIQSNLQSQVLTARSNAVEVLDNLIDKDTKRRLLPLVEELPREKVLDLGEELYPLKRQSPEAWVEEFLSSDEPWLVVVALYVIRELGLDHLTAQVLDHLQHNDPVARETALRTLAVLVSPQELANRAGELTQDGHPNVRAYAESMRKEAEGYAAQA